jgi:hypothetical protein
VSAVTPTVIEESTDDGWADFESNTVPSTEQPLASPPEEPVAQVEADEDDFGEFSEVQVTAKPPPTPSLPIVSRFRLISTRGVNFNASIGSYQYGTTGISAVHLFPNRRVERIRRS